MYMVSDVSTPAILFLLTETFSNVVLPTSDHMGDDFMLVFIQYALDVVLFTPHTTSLSALMEVGDNVAPDTAAHAVVEV